MYIQQLYTNCLAEAAYYIESNGEAAIIDPLRETEPYEQLAKERGASIKYVFETHFHADFISGHIDLAAKTGAHIIYGPTAKAGYDIIVAKDEQLFKLGDIHIKVLHTPGHTMESSCFLVIDEKGNEHSIFTGDTLFIGDVGRPDLAVKSDLSREDLARHLYQSLNEKIVPLKDHVLVYPAHGPGSQCGKAMSQETQSTIGVQKQTNYALNTKSEDDFVEQVVCGLNLPPQYFPKNAQINKEGYNKSIDAILQDANRPLSVEAFELEKNQKDTIIIDSRTATNFSSGFIPGSINIGLDGFFAVWVGTLIENLNSPILLVTKKGEEEKTALRLARVGYENVIGYLDGGIESWKASNKEVSIVENICPAKFIENAVGQAILDVRKESEYEAGHIDQATNVPLANIEKQLNTLDSSRTYYIYCKGGYRSMIAASILKKNGFNKLINVKKGYDAVIDPSKNCCSLTS